MPTIAQTATLVHGFTMADVESAARVAMRQRNYLANLLDHDDMHETAWHAIVEELYSCSCGWGSCTRTVALTFSQLVEAGRAAISEAGRHELRHHGRAGGEEAPNFAKYWLPVRRLEHWDSDGFSDRLCELLALRDALAVLTVDQYEAVATMAVYDNNGADAASALGLNYNTFWYRLDVARKRIYEVWHEEVAARVDVRLGESCRRGHPRAEHGQRNGQGRWECRECKRLTDREGHRRRRAERNAARLQAEAEPLAQAHRDPAA